MVSKVCGVKATRKMQTGTRIMAVAWVAFVVGACGGMHETRAPNTADASRESAQTVTSVGLGLLRLCDSLATVEAYWPESRDTVLESEGVEWPGRVIAIQPATYLLFESSWADSTRVWRISTNDSTFRTESGVRPGMSIAALRGLRLSLVVHLEEGSVVLDLGDDSVGAVLDERALAPGDTGGIPGIGNLLPESRVVAIVSGRNCRK